MIEYLNNISVVTHRVKNISQNDVDNALEKIAIGRARCQIKTPREVLLARMRDQATIRSGPLITFSEGFFFRFLHC